MFVKMVCELKQQQSKVGGGVVDIICVYEIYFYLYFFLFCHSDFCSRKLSAQRGFSNIIKEVGFVLRSCEGSKMFPIITLKQRSNELEGKARSHSRLSVVLLQRGLGAAGRSDLNWRSSSTKTATGGAERCAVGSCEKSLPLGVTLYKMSKGSRLLLDFQAYFTVFRKPWRVGARHEYVYMYMSLNVMRKPVLNAPLLSNTDNT